MGLFDNIFNKKQITASSKANGYFKTLTAYSPVFTSWSGQLYESELVRSAIDARARHISKLKVEVIGSARPTLQTKLRVAPNEFQTWGQFLYRLSTILDMQNTAFIVPVTDDYGSISGYYPVLPSQCEIVQFKNQPWLRYHFQSGNTAAVPIDECGILTKYQYKDDFFGERNTALASTMSLIDLQHQGISEAVKSSASYRFMAQVNNFTKSEDLAKERKRFSAENLASDADGGGLLLFPNTYTNIQQIKNSSYTIDAEQMKLIQTNVYNYFGVNEQILQNSADGDMLDAFFNGAIEPFSIQLSEVLTSMTFTNREISAKNTITVTSNRLMYMSIDKKISLIRELGDRGFITINEAREMLNLAPLDNEGGLRPVRGEYYQMNDSGEYDIAEEEIDEEDVEEDYEEEFEEDVEEEPDEIEEEFEKLKKELGI